MKSKPVFYAGVAAFIKWKREQLGLTISQVASQAGEQYNTIRAIESGSRFQFHQVHWMTEVLGISVDELIEHTNVNPNVGNFHGQEENENQSEQEEHEKEGIDCFL